MQKNTANDLPIVYDWHEDDKDAFETEDSSDEDNSVAGDGLGQPNESDPADVEIEYEVDENGEVKLRQDKRSGRYYRRYPFKRRNNNRL